MRAERAGARRETRPRLPPLVIALAASTLLTTTWGCNRTVEDEQTPSTKRPSAAEAHASGETRALRTYDAGLARWLGASAGEDTRQDIFPDIPARADLFREGEVFARLTLDVDRSGKTDEVWRLEGDEVIREIVAGEDAGQRHALRGGRWVRLE